MAELTASYNIDSASQTIDLDETRSWQVWCTTGGTVAVDGGDPVTMTTAPAFSKLELGPGVGKIVTDSDFRGTVIPRSDCKCG